MPSVRRSFVSDAGQLVIARGFAVSQLARWGLEPLRDVVALLVSELFTNAIQHGRGPVTLDMSVGGQSLYVGVTDCGGGEPVIRPAEPSDAQPGGWGLHMVERLSREWGTTVDEGRTVVWLRMALPR